MLQGNVTGEDKGFSLCTSILQISTPGFVPAPGNAFGPKSATGILTVCMVSLLVENYNSSILTKHDMKMVWHVLEESPGQDIKKNLLYKNIGKPLNMKSYGRISRNWMEKFNNFQTLYTCYSTVLISA